MFVSQALRCPPHTTRHIQLRIRLHRPHGILRIGLSGYNFAYFNNQFALVGILPVRSFVIVPAERSDCCLVEQMTTLVLPPPVPNRAMTGIALSDSANSVRFTWLYNFILHYYRRIIRYPVLMVSCDRGGYCTPPPLPLASNTNGGCPCSSCRSVPVTSCVTYITAPPGRSEQGLVLYQSPFRKPFKPAPCLDVSSCDRYDLVIWLSINNLISDSAAQFYRFTKHLRF